MCGAGWVLVSAAADLNFSGFMFVLLVFSGYVGFVGGSLYYGWRTLWYGIPLVVLSVPSAWMNVVQGAVLLLLWLGPLFYFIPASSGLMSIVEHTRPTVASRGANRCIQGGQPLHQHVIRPIKPGVRPSDDPDLDRGGGVRRPAFR